MKHFNATDLRKLYHQTLCTLTQEPASLAGVCAVLDSACATAGALSWQMRFEQQMVQSDRCEVHPLPRGFTVVRSLLFTNQQAIGEVEWFCGRAGIAFEKESVLGDIAQLCAMTLHNRVLQTQVWQDALTGLHNQRFLAEYIAQAKAEQSELGVVIASIDIDHFKAINDRDGHAAGDAVLQRVAAAIQACCRKEDFHHRLCRDFGVRPGGDEFLLILRDVPQAELEQVHQDLQARLEKALQKLAPVKFSYGIANGRTQSIDTLIEQADKRMYQHKNLTRAVPRKRLVRAEMAL